MAKKKRKQVTPDEFTLDLEGLDLKLDEDMSIFEDLTIFDEEFEKDLERLLAELDELVLLVDWEGLEVQLEELELDFDVSLFDEVEA